VLHDKDGVFGPRGLPPAVVARLNGTLADILKDEGVRARLATAGVVAQGSTPEAFGAFMANEFKRWNAVREAAGIPQQYPASASLIKKALARPGRDRAAYPNWVALTAAAITAAYLLRELPTRA
jgi:hypothetical protein